MTSATGLLEAVVLLDFIDERLLFNALGSVELAADTGTADAAATHADLLRFLERVLNFEADGAVELLWQGSPTPAMSRMRSGRLWPRT